MTPEQARRQAGRRIRRRRRRIILRALFIVPAFLGFVALLGEFVAVSEEPAEAAALRSALRVPSKGVRPSQLRVPVPVFRPSILPGALEMEIPDIDPLDLELRDRRVERFLEKRRLALARKTKTGQEKPEIAREPAVKPMTVNLIQVSGIQSHVLEIVGPRVHADQSEEAISDVLPVHDPNWPWGWTDIPVFPGFGLRFLERPTPVKKKKSEEEEEEEEELPAVPEPSPATLLVLGLTVLGITCRRRSGNCLE